MSSRKIPPILLLSFTFFLLSVLFFIPVPEAFREKLGAALLNTGHIIFFTLFALAFYPLLKSPHRVRMPAFILLVFLLSLVIETIQSQVGRAFQWGDILRNELGTLFGMSLYLLLHRTLMLQVRIAFLFIIVAAIIIERIPLIEQAMAR